MENKPINKCSLAKDVASGDPVEYYNFNRNKKRSDKFCPRCNALAVNRDLRKCMACGGKLLWAGDSAKDFDDRMDYWFMFCTDLFGTTGWYAKDYFIVPIK